MSWIDGGDDSLIKWDKVACENRQDYWQWCFLQPLIEAFCNFLTHIYVSIACYPCTRQILVLEELLSNKCLWEDLKDEEHGTHKGHTNHQVMMPIVLGRKYGASYNTSPRYDPELPSDVN